MKLTKYQKAKLLEHEWDAIENEDGSIFGEVCEHFDLTGEQDEVKLLVIATAEGE